METFVFFSDFSPHCEIAVECNRWAHLRGTFKSDLEVHIFITLLFFSFQRYRLALEMSPPYRQSELLLNLGSVHHAMGEFEAAEKHYTQCLKLEPHNQVVIDNMKLLELKHH